MMEKTSHLLARDIAALVDVPKPVATAMAAHQAATHASVDEKFDPALECMTIAPDDVAALVTRMAQNRVLRAEHDPARAEVAELLARRIGRELAANGAEILESLRPIFTDAAKAFTTAAASLPADLRPEALVRAGSDVLARHERATAAAATLGKLRTLRGELASLGVRAAGDRRIEQATRVLDIENLAAVEKLQQAPTESHLSPWSSWLAVPGVSLAWPSLAEQSATIARLTAAMPVRPPKKDPTIRLRGPKVA